MTIIYCYNDVEYIEYNTALQAVLDNEQFNNNDDFDVNCDNYITEYDIEESEL